MFNINTDQKAVFIYAMRMKTKLQQLMTDITWFALGDDQNGRFLQHEVSNQEEVDKLINRIKNLFNGFDLDIQQSNNKESTITITIPTYIIKESLKPDSQIIWPSVINESQMVAKLTKRILEINEQLKQSLENCHSRNLFIVASCPSELKPDSYYLIRSNGNTDVFFYVKESKEIVTKDISEYFLLYRILETASVDKMQTNGIQPFVYNNILFDRALIMRSWEDSYNAVLTNLQKDGINAAQLKRIIAKSLQNLCAISSEKKVELMVIFQNAKDDFDLPLVIQRRFMQNHKNDRDLFVLNKSFSNFLIDQNENNDYKIPINKLSILHHWSSEVDFFSKVEIIDFTEKAIEKMPNLETVVMRGCASASNSSGNFVFKPKSCKILSSKRSIETAPVNENEFLFQQVAEKNQPNTAAIVTYLKFYDMNHNLVTKKSSDIPLNNNGNKLSFAVEQKLASTAKANNLPLLSLPALDKLMNETRQAWLRNEPIHKEDKVMLQATLTRTRTFAVENFPKESLTDTLDKELQKKGININIKGYGGPYEVYPKAGIMTASSHDHHKLPKALMKLKK